MASKKSNSTFIPSWYEEPPKPGSYRSIFKWGDPEGFKHPNKRLFSLMKQEFNLKDDYFKEPKTLGQEEVRFTKKPVELEESHIRTITGIVGEENVSTRDYDRLKYSSGKTMEEILELRKGIIREVTDLVVHPRNKEEVRKIVEYCK